MKYDSGPKPSTGKLTNFKNAAVAMKPKDCGETLANFSKEPIGVKTNALSIENAANAGANRPKKTASATARTRNYVGTSKNCTVMPVSWRKLASVTNWNASTMK